MKYKEGRGETDFQKLNCAVSFCEWQREKGKKEGEDESHPKVDSLQTQAPEYGSPVSTQRGKKMSFAT